MNSIVTMEEVSSACEVLRAKSIDPIQATRGQISGALGIGDRRARTIREWIQRGNIALGEPTPLQSVPEVREGNGEDTATFDSAYSAFQEWIGNTHRIRTESAGPLPRKFKAVVASDFHVPFQFMDAVAALVEEESADTDLLIIDGDLGDFWATSRHPKSKRVIGPCEELGQAQALLTLLAERFKRIVVVDGNHDQRPAKYLANVLPPDVLDYINMTGPMVFKPLQFISQGLENVEVVEPIRSEYAEFGFFYQLGDMVCTHAEKYSIVPNKATNEVNKWIHTFAIPQGIIKGPVRCVVQGHTHQAGSVLGDYGVLCIENGCLSSLQDYHGSARILTPRPLARGWSVIYQEDGVTDQRNSRFKPFKS